MRAHLYGLCITRFLTSPALWAHYATVEALRAFWKLDIAVKRELWGPPIDLAALDRKFDPNRFTNATLGLVETSSPF
jgi:hypothetical protein